MVTIKYQGKEVSCRDGETVLDAMLRQGIDFPFSCRSGICHVCLHRVECGEIPLEAQQGLDEEKRSQGLFLPCKCYPSGEMSIAGVDDKAQAQRDAQRCDKPEPDPQMWQALEEGALLTRILEDFYTQVYADERLASYFEGVTKQRAVEKQFLFLRQIFTGEKVYFGDRPRNAHHWMVISDELFDYRESMMAETLRRHGLEEALVQRWMAMEECFRPDLVKDKPWPRKMGDMEIPVEGYDEIVLEVGSLCDSCQREVDAGETVRYHLRLGSIYCSECMSKE
jgi:ferredoxin/truncated hemoglobin YjbI